MANPQSESRRLRDDPAAWRKWGPYLSERAWGTVREDYSEHGDAWESFPHDHAWSRVYRWNEDGLGGICDDQQRLCFAFAFWNGRDPILKERIFGLTGPKGNHGEDAKEYWWYLDSTPTHSWMRWRYLYPQAGFPYADLVAENRRRAAGDPEYELLDTGVFDGDRYWEITADYAKAAPDDLCIRATIRNAAPDEQTIELLPTLWFRNTWSWGLDDRRPSISAAGGALRRPADVSQLPEILRAQRRHAALSHHPDWRRADTVLSDATHTIHRALTADGWTPRRRQRLRQLHARKGFTEGAAMAVAVLAAVVTYAILAVHPWPHTPLNAFLATFGRANTAAWPAQIAWYVAAVAMAGLALWPVRRSSPLICGLAAAYFAWIGIAYFAWLMPGIHYSWLWATAFTLQAVLLVVAGVMRSDLVFRRPGPNLASGLGAVFIGYALIGYPLVGLAGGHPLRTLPVFGVSPCATVVFFFGLLLWARPPTPKYVLLVPLAWALGAAPPDLARGVTADYGMLVAALITAGVIIWRDRASSPAWQTATAGLLLALMIAWSGHEDVLAGLAVLLVAVTLAQAIRGHRQPPHAGSLPPARTGKLKVS